MQKLLAVGVRCFSGACSEIYKEKCFDLYPEVRPIAPLNNAALLGKSSLMFEVHPTLTHDGFQLNLHKIQSCLNSFYYRS